MCAAFVTDDFISANGLSLHYRHWSSEVVRPGAQPVLLLHGLASSSYIWNLVAPRLAEQGHRVIALDQRGHGESASPARGYDFASILADDRAVIEQLGLSQPVIVGHSWGAMVALEYATLPGTEVSALVLVDGALQQFSRRPGWSLEQALIDLAPPRYAGISRETFLAFFEKSPLAPLWTPEIEASVLHIVEQHPDGSISPRLAFENHLQIIEAMWYQPTFELYKKLSCPLKLVVAERKPVDEVSRSWTALRQAGLEEIRALQPQADIVELPDTIHDIPLQRPEELTHEILSLISRL